MDEPRPPARGGHPHPPRPNHKSDILLLIHEVPAPILLPALLVRFSAERLLLAVADRLNAISADAGLHQCIAHRSRTAVTQGQVIFGRAALVAVSLNGEADGRMLLEKIRVAL